MSSNSIRTATGGERSLAGVSGREISVGPVVSQVAALAGREAANQAVITVEFTRPARANSTPYTSFEYGGIRRFNPTQAEFKPFRIS